MEILKINSNFFPKSLFFQPKREMDANLFSQQLKTTYRRAAQLYQHTKTISPESETEAELLAQSLEELRTALEELHVAEEEILLQNQELAIARSQVEIERQRYCNLFEFAPDAYLVTDSLGVIREANRAAAKLLNIPQQRLIGKPLATYILAPEKQAFRTRLHQLGQNDSTQEWEIGICPRERAAIDAAITVAAIGNRSDASSNWCWLIRDITARKQAEATVRAIQSQNLELQEAARMKSHFLAIMSHELRSPLNAIVGFAQLLLRQAHYPLVNGQESMVTRILNSGRHLLNLIDDILDLSKIEANKLELALEELNLVELVTNTTEEIRCLLEQKNLTLKVECNLQNPYVVNDSSRLRQVLVNLLSNGIKFTEVGGVEVKVWEISADHVAIAVKDTGIGISESELQYIFQEFRQADRTLARKYGGTGLGLAITDRLVQMMAGKIEVESQVGQGSTFYVELPRQVQKQ